MYLPEALGYKPIVTLSLKDYVKMQEPQIQKKKKSLDV